MLLLLLLVVVGMGRGSSVVCEPLCPDWVLNWIPLLFQPLSAQAAMIMINTMAVQAIYCHAQRVDFRHHYYCSHHHTNEHYYTLNAPDTHYEELTGALLINTHGTSQFIRKDGTR